MNGTNTSTNASQTPTQTPNVWYNSPTQPTPPPNSPRNKSPLLIGLITVITASLVAGGGYLGYKQWQYNDLQTQQIIKRQSLQLDIQNSREAGKFEDCIQQAKNFPQNNQVISPEDNQKFSLAVNGLLRDCQKSLAVQLLAKAKDSAASDQLINAIGAGRKIENTLDSETYAQAQELIVKWSNEILTRAEVQYQLGEIKIAQDWAKAIPETVPVYQKAQKRSEYWQTEWNANQNYYQNAKDGLDNGQLDRVITEANQIRNQYWQKKVKPIKDDANYLLTAKTALNNNQWNQAIQSANKVTTNTGKSQAESIIAKASDEKHLSAARTALDNGEWNKAIESVNKVTTDYGKEQAKSIKDTANDEKHLSAARTAFNKGEWDKVLNEISKVKTDEGKEKADEIKEQVEGLIGLAAVIYLLNNLSGSPDVQASP